MATSPISAPHTAPDPAAASRAPSPSTSGLGASAATSLVAPPVVGSLLTAANAVTLGRTFAAVGLGVWAVATANLPVLAVAYAVYWIGDMADGAVARHIGCETRAGAVLDIVSDRACTAVLCMGVLVHLPTIWPITVAFLLSFMVLDTMLSLAFLCWPLLSPNYFHRVDRRTWQLNWSPVAKAANTAGVIVAVAVGAHAVALVLIVLIAAIKVWSAVRIARLLGPQPTAVS